MIVINQIKILVENDSVNLENIIKKKLKYDGELSYSIKSKSIDARNKDQIYYVYSVYVVLDKKVEERILKKNNNNNVMLTKKQEFQPIKKLSSSNKKETVVIVGTGPAGLFCGYVLALNGYCPVLVERGMSVTDRTKAVEAFWKGESLKPNGNVQFGEGGAGTFSDGKLNTGNKDKFGYQQFMLETFVAFGAPEEILYLNKPHIGTDYLAKVMINMRKELESLGAKYLFSSQVTDLIIKDSKISSVIINDKDTISCDKVVLAIGHSARDTFSLLYEKGITMEKKAFAVGLRVAHPQKTINEAQYGKKYSKLLPAADYKMVHKASNGRNVFSFCMCPGGYIVNASSKEKMLAVNGMSYHSRDGKWANGAIVANVNPDDFPDDSVLSGVAFQEKWEKAAYEEGDGAIPVQLFRDFKKNQKTKETLHLEDGIKGHYKSGNVRACLPNFLNDAIMEGILAFNKKVAGFASDDVILAGVETRTSSPVRILRNESYEANILGVYPCGEGGGYAGGITSAAVDGIKVALAIMEQSL